MTGFLREHPGVLSAGMSWGTADDGTRWNRNERSSEEVSPDTARHLRVAENRQKKLSRYNLHGQRNFAPASRAGNRGPTKMCAHQIRDTIAPRQVDASRHPAVAEVETPPDMWSLGYAISLGIRPTPRAREMR
ncbi:hypothetical protein [Nocardia transvalensis]|uniref:hypothetical protein n=1 Tax=Nocardia transvalensis TaxID=37333 RepID=UPI0018959872|nr:hypothetical protein [Nocardia transvalensis]MBF6327132.1 hypothetical protein [Nocardia transvalensis]